MKIFLDESGVFSLTENQRNSYSCFGGLIIPEDCIEEIEFVFKKFKTRINALENEEIKGKDLNEIQYNEILTLLEKYDILFVATAIDTGFYAKRNILLHQQTQANKIRSAILEGDSNDIKVFFNSLADNLTKLSLPLYIQSVCTRSCIENIIRKASLYYVQRKPNLLSKWDWLIDAKDSKITKYEKIWKEVSLPLLQTSFLKEPLEMLSDADYSFMISYEKPIGRNNIYELIKNIKNIDKETSFDISSLLEKMNFMDSKKNNLLQISDIFVTGLRRAFKNTLSYSGWGKIVNFVVHAKIGNNAIELIDLTGELQSTKIPDHTKAIMHHFNTKSKQMIQI